MVDNKFYTCYTTDIEKNKKIQQIRTDEKYRVRNRIN